MLELQSRYVALLAAIRPHAVNIVDSFDLRDEVIGSALGCWDGNVYQSKQSSSYSSFRSSSHLLPSFRCRTV